MLEKPELRPSMPQEALADQLYSWMCGDKPMMEHILENISKPPVDSHMTQEHTPILLASSQDGETRFYYGSEGMRESLICLFDRILKIDQPCPIYLVSDLNMEWLHP